MTNQEKDFSHFSNSQLGYLLNLIPYQSSNLPPPPRKQFLWASKFAITRQKRKHQKKSLVGTLRTTPIQKKNCGLYEKKREKKKPCFLFGKKKLLQINKKAQTLLSPPLSRTIPKSAISPRILAPSRWEKKGFFSQQPPPPSEKKKENLPKSIFYLIR